ncbi:MAG: sigma-70 family RNA polymerase sigma factor [Pseudomonadota bacterium]
MTETAELNTQHPSAWWSDQLQRLAEHSEQAVFVELYKHFGPKVATYLARLGATAAMSEELTQETMLSVWRKASSYKREKAAASTWIFTIARNQFIDAMRKQNSSPEVPSQDTVEPVASDDPVGLVDAEPLRREIKNLPIVQSQVLYLSYFKGLSHSEIAADMNIPLGSVKSNLRLAFQKLRAKLRTNQ